MSQQIGNNVFQGNNMQFPVFHGERRREIRTEFTLGFDHRQFSEA